MNSSQKRQKVRRFRYEKKAQTLSMSLNQSILNNMFKITFDFTSK